MKIWKIFSLLLIVSVVSIIACAMFSDDSSAEVTSGTTGDCTWTLDGTKLTISGNGAIADYDSSKPSPWERSITEVIIENGVTSIGHYAFRYCTSLTSITIPNSVTSIGRYAFWECTSLTSITIPDSVTSIGPYAFVGCSSLTSITIPNSVTYIGDGAFLDCPSLTSITIPNSVTSIDEQAFSHCTSLTSITIPSSVTSIGKRAFSHCTSLTSITIPDSVTSIGDCAFFPFEFYESNGVDYIAPTAENLAGHTFINKSGKMVKQEGAQPSTTTYTVTSGFPMIYVILGAIVAVIAITAIAFVIKKR